MKELCLTISAGRLPKRWPIKLTDIHADLRLACSIFTELLDARHRADYDVGVDISLAEARSLVDAAEQFQTLMDTLSQDKSEAFRLFAIALLAQPSIY